MGKKCEHNDLKIHDAIIIDGYCTHCITQAFQEVLYIIDEVNKHHDANSFVDRRCPMCTDMLVNKIKEKMKL